MKIVELTQGFKSLIDDEDFEKVSAIKWTIQKNKLAKGFSYYAHGHLPKSGKYGRTILLHRFILNAKKGITVDHIDGDGLNNQKSNLRLCSQINNCRNTKNNWGSSKFKGISKKNGKFRAYIKLNYKQIYLGIFASEEEAANIYNKYAELYFGEYARLNVIV